jgi:ABC-type nitrate/sulfonate/bicarbonate transport system substrate-binding protein
MNWKRALLMLVALPALAGGAATALAADKVKVVALQGTQLFPVRIMQSKGIAAKYGIDMDLMVVASPQGSYTAMQTGEVNIGFTGWIVDSSSPTSTP